MTEPQRDLDGKERWLSSLECSRRRRVAAPLRRRDTAAYGRRAGVTVAVLLAGLGGSLAIAGLPGTGEGPGRAGAASESFALAEGDHGDLRLGSSGAAVAAVERRLRELGYAVEADDYFDRRTRRAVRRFQRSEGISPDGVVGLATWRALFASGGAPAGPGEPALASRGGPSSDEESGARFAVRMAAPAELASEDRERIGLEPAGSQGQRKPGTLVAIEFENGPAGDGGSSDPEGRAEPSSGEPSGAHKAAEAPDVSTTRDRAAARKPAGEDSSAVESERPPAPARGGACGSGRMVAPVRGATPTSSYRSAHRPSHAGVDLAAPSGTPIRSAACGIVSFLAGTAQSGGYGNYVCVKHSSRLTTCYAHLSRFSDERVGDRVRRGEVIGFVGSTGRSTGPHLHFETRSGNPYGRNDVDPAPYLRGRAIPGTRVGRSAVGGPDLVSPPRQQADAARENPGLPARAAAAPAPTGEGVPPESVEQPPAAQGDPGDPAAQGERPSADPQAKAPPRVATHAAGTDAPSSPEPSTAAAENSPAIAPPGGSAAPAPAPGDQGTPPATEARAGPEEPQAEDPTDGTVESESDSADSPAAQSGGEAEADGAEAPGPATDVEPPVFETPASSLEGIDSLFEPQADPVPGQMGVPVEEGQGLAQEWLPVASP